MGQGSATLATEAARKGRKPGTSVRGGSGVMGHGRVVSATDTGGKRCKPRTVVRGGRHAAPGKTGLPRLRPYQAEAGRAIVAAALEGRGLTFTVVMARQAGKNELSAVLELFLLQRNAWRAVDGI